MKEKVKLVVHSYCEKCRRDIDEKTVSLRRIVTNEDGLFAKFCTDCVHGTTSVKDVYYGYGSGTHVEENICDPATGQPIPFSSKGEKWAAMQKAGVRECGDKVHGARTNFTK